jgi:hypothetical protein
MPSFASVSELEAHMQRQFGVDEFQTAEQTLELATGLIQSHVGHDIFPTATVQMFTRPQGFSRLGGMLKLRHRPVIDVESVIVDGAETTFVVDKEAGLLYATVEEPLVQTLPDHPGSVTVVYTHGFDPVPAEVKSVCLDIAGRVLENPNGYTQFSIGEFSAGYGSHSAAVLGLALSVANERTLAGLRR